MWATRIQLLAESLLLAARAGCGCQSEVSDVQAVGASYEGTCAVTVLS